MFAEQNSVYEECFQNKGVSWEDVWLSLAHARSLSSSILHKKNIHSDHLSKRFCYQMGMMNVPLSISGLLWTLEVLTHAEDFQKGLRYHHFTNSDDMFSYNIFRTIAVWNVLQGVRHPWFFSMSIYTWLSNRKGRKCVWGFGHDTSPISLYLPLHSNYLW